MDMETRLALSENEITGSNRNNGDFFYVAFAAVAMIVPILLVTSASTLPEGLERAAFIVTGHGVLLAVLLSAVVLRVAYALGFRRAMKVAAAEINYSVPA
jgi:hypothetical protein